MGGQWDETGPETLIFARSERMWRICDGRQSNRPPSGRVAPREARPASKTPAAPPLSQLTPCESMTANGESRGSEPAVPPYTI